MKNQAHEQSKVGQLCRFQIVLLLALFNMGLSGCDQANQAAGKTLLAIDKATRHDDDDEELPPVPPLMSVVLFQGEQLTSGEHCAEIKITNAVRTNRPPTDYFLGNYSRYGDFYADDRNTHQIRGNMHLEQVDENGRAQVFEKAFDLGVDDDGAPNGTAILASPYVATNGNFTFVIQYIEIDVIANEHEGAPFTSSIFWGTTGQVEIDVEEKTLRRSTLPDDRIAFVCGYKYKAYLLFENHIPTSPSDPLYAEMLDLQDNGVDLSAW